MNTKPEDFIQRCPKCNKGHGGLQTDIISPQVYNLCEGCKVKELREYSKKDVEFKARYNYARLVTGANIVFIDSIEQL